VTKYFKVSMPLAVNQFTIFTPSTAQYTFLYELLSFLLTSLINIANS